jgi:four helix bundle protein
LQRKSVSNSKLKRQKVKVDKNQNIVERTFNFAIDILKLSGQLDEKISSQRIILKQVIRSGTSVGANLEEAQAAESKADFIHKYSIALKEARETKYWLKLLRASNLVEVTSLETLIIESDEVCRIIAQIIINARKRKE